MTRKLPATLTVELNSWHPRFVCYVTDGKGTANGGFWRGFKSHAEMRAWLLRNGYSTARAEK